MSIYIVYAVRNATMVMQSIFTLQFPIEYTNKENALNKKYWVTFFPAQCVFFKLSEQLSCNLLPTERFPAHSIHNYLCTLTLENVYL